MRLSAHERTHASRARGCANPTMLRFPEMLKEGKVTDAVGGTLEANSAQLARLRGLSGRRVLSGERPSVPGTSACGRCRVGGEAGGIGSWRDDRRRGRAEEGSSARLRKSAPVWASDLGPAR